MHLFAGNTIVGPTVFSSVKQAARKPALERKRSKLIGYENECEDFGSADSDAQSTITCESETSREFSANADCNPKDKDISDSKRQKIESAINSLKLDKESIHDLRVAFNCELDCTDAATALLNLHGATNYISKTSDKTSDGFLSRVRDLSIRVCSTNIKSAHRPSIILGDNPSKSIPYITPKYYQPQTRRYREVSKIQAKCRQTENYYEIVAFTPQFEHHYLRVALIKYGETVFPNAILIEGLKNVVIKLKDGTFVEKIITAKCVTLLGNKYAAKNVVVTPFKRFNLNIRVMKQ